MRAPPAALLLLAAVAAAACDWSTPLGWLGVRNIREVGSDVALAWIGSGRGLWVQPADRERTLPRLDGAVLVAPDQAVPASLLGSEKWIVVVDPRTDRALGLAARLARAGVPRVAVVTGDLAPLTGRRTASRGPAGVQPPEPTGHPRR